METEIYQPDAQVGELKLWRPPDAVIAEAKQAADALQKIIEGSAIKPIQFGDKKHLLHEHWEILGHFYGYCTKIESAKYVEFPGNGRIITGFDASALLLVERTGAVVGRAESMCLDEEDNWGDVAEYEWQDTFNKQGDKVGRAKVEVGTKPKPLFQLKSMAQTRASAKAFRTKLAWVAVLAGYSPTPAQEMIGTPRSAKQADDLPTEIKRKTSPPSQPGTNGASQPSRPAANTRPAPKPQTDRTITEPKARRFYAIWKQSGKSRDQVTAYLREKFGIERDLDIPEARYNEACHWAQS